MPHLLLATSFGLMLFVKCFSVDEDYLKALDEKHIRYDAEFSRYLMAKYFSGKSFNGGDQTF